MENQKFDFFFKKGSNFGFWRRAVRSPTLVIDTSMERSSRVLQHETQKFEFFWKWFEIRILTFTKSWNHLSFVNISPTLVLIHQWKGLHEYYTMETQKIDFLFQKSSKLLWLLTKRNHIIRQYQSYISNCKVFTSHPFSKKFEIRILTFVEELKSSQFNISNWYWNGLHEYYTWKPRNVKISKNSKLTKLNSVRTPSFRMPRKDQYQSYISNWYVNGKVFTSTTTWEPKNLIFFSKKFEIEFDLYFDLCRAEIIQEGLNMHLYVHRGCIVVPLRVEFSKKKYAFVTVFDGYDVRRQPI